MISDEAVVSFVLESWRDRGYGPTIREVGAAVGLRSSSSAWWLVYRLLRDGKLLSTPDSPRTLRVPPAWRCGACARSTGLLLRAAEVGWEVSCAACGATWIPVPGDEWLLVALDSVSKRT